MSARAETFHRLRATTQEVLAHVPAQRSLDDFGQELSPLLDDTFIVERHLGRLVAPAQPAPVDAIGVYVMLPNEKTVPNILRYLNQTAGKPVSDSRLSRITDAILPNPLSFECAAGHMCGPSRHAELLMIGPRLEEIAPYTQAAAVAHELGHIRYARQFEEETGLPYSDLDSEKMTEQSVLTERYAYGISRSILELSGTVHPDANYDSVLSLVQKATSPQAAASSVIIYRHHVTKGLKEPQSLATDNAVTAYAAQAFTEVYAAGQTTPTPNEVAAYRRMGLVP